MRRTRGLTRWAALQVLSTTAAVAHAAMDCSVATFEAILAGNSAATVRAVASVPQNGSFGDAATNLAFPANATGLPALCAVNVTIASSDSSAYDFGVFLPLNGSARWNGRMLTTGNGGYGGGINWPDMGTFSHYGFATVSTDTGHSSNPADGTWGFHQPERLFDWGYRAMHGTVVTAKQIVAAFYGDDIKFSYYASCSTGGRQGLKELQDHPDSFDGVSVGAPAWWATHLPASTLKQGLYNLPADGAGHIDPSKFPAIVAEMIRQCDPQDGLKDGIISDPFGCNFDFNQLLCTGNTSTSSSCLTAPQIETAIQFYSDYVETNQTFIFPGVSLGVDPTFLLSFPSTLGSDFFKYWVHNDSNWDMTTLQYSDIALADSINPGQATADDFGALEAFHARGGKLLHYHGMADQLIPTKSSLYFHDHVYRTLAPRGVDLDAFYRFFLVPGMGHCSGADRAPWYIAAGSQAPPAGATHGVPGFDDAEHDAILALMRWVEEGTAPDRLVATKFANDTVAGGVESQRPLCVYPKLAKYDGSGDPDVPGSWTCETLY